MRPLAALTWLCIIRTNAMYTHTFLQAFNRLGLSQWDGIEQDIAWGIMSPVLWDCFDPASIGPFLHTELHVGLEGRLLAEFEL